MSINISEQKGIRMSTLTFCCPFYLLFTPLPVVSDIYNLVTTFTTNKQLVVLVLLYDVSQSNQSSRNKMFTWMKTFLTNVKWRHEKIPETLTNGRQCRGKSQTQQTTGHHGCSLESRHWIHLKSTSYNLFPGIIIIFLAPSGAQKMQIFVCSVKSV